MLLTSLKSLFDEVKECEDIDIISRKGGFPTRDKQHVIKEVHILEKRHGFVVSDNIIELMYLPATLQLYWNCQISQDDKLDLLGGFWLSNMTNVIDSPRNRVKISSDIIEEEEFGPKQRAVASNSVYFDVNLRNYGYDTATILALGEDTKPGLWLLDEVELVELEISIKEYVEALVLTKGTFYWQYLFCSQEDYDATPFYKKRYISEGIDMLKRVFPDHDYSLLDNRLKKLNANKL